MEHNTDKIFREGLAGHRIEPPPHLWQQIAGAAVASQAGINGRHRHKTTFWWWSMPVLILLTGIGYVTLAPEILSDEPLLFPAGEGAQISFVEYDMSVPLPPRNAEPDNAVLLPEPHTLTTPQPAPAMATTTAPSTIPSTTPEAVASSPDATAPPTSIAAVEPSEHTVPESTPLPEKAPVTDREPAISIPSDHEDPSHQNILPEPVISATPTITDKVTAISPVTPAVTAEIPSAETEVPPKGQVGDDKDTAQVTQQIAETVSSDAQRKLFTHDLSRGWLIHTGVQMYQMKEPWNSEWHSPPETDLHYRIMYRRVSLTTGAGMGMLNQSHNALATLKQVDTVSYYQYVSSIGFQPVYSPEDSSIIGFIPVNIVTISKPQLDTSYHTADLRVNYRTTWFRVPVILGYDLYHSEKWTLSAHTGLIWYRRMTERQNIPVVPPEETLVALHEPLFSFTDHFWMYQYGISVRYDINHNWYAEATVARRRFLNLWYQPASHAPGSAMISTSLGFRL